MAVVEKLRKSPQEEQFVSEMIVVTPEMAASWLEMNVRNRKPRRGVVDKYARDMKSGRWQITGDAIRFDRNANLIDGQHRLMACVKSDASFSTLVIYGLPTEAQDVMDQGAVRRADDVLALHGWNNTTGITSACRLLLAERDGLQVPRSLTYSTAEVLACIEKHRVMSRYIPVPRSLPPGISLAQVGFLRYVSAEILRDNDGVQAAMFEVLKTGIPSYPGDPIHMYRERVLRMSKDISQISRTARWDTFKHAFNLFRRTESVTSLRFGRDYCKIIGLDISKL
jgi:hypothetical protein